MNPMRIYVAGPMTGYPELNFPAFHAEASRLRAMGHEVVNPAEINPAPPDDNFTPAQFGRYWSACMRADIAQLITCDAIAMLPGWSKSTGARLEHHIASQLGMEVLLP